MRIAIDVRKINDFGIGTYLRNLLKFLPTTSSGHEYHLICRDEDEQLLAAFSAKFSLSFVSAQNYSVAEHFLIPARLKQIRADLYHAPHYVIPYLLPCRSVVTVHDVIQLLFPQYLPSKLAQYYAAHMIRRATAVSRILMTVSEASKNDLLRMFPVDASKIRVIPNGIDPSIKIALSDTDLESVRHRLQIKGRSVLFVGNIKPHKNIERLIAAFSQLRSKPSCADLTLIVVGDEITKYPSLRRAVERHQVRPFVRFFGFVPEKTLVALYQIASLFVFPSLYEGFGLPPLEAMANGTPVVTSRISSLPEVVGDAAVMVNPYSVDEITSAMFRVLSDHEFQANLKKAGYQQAEKFNWENSARQIQEVYSEALS